MKEDEKLKLEVNLGSLKEKLKAIDQLIDSFPELQDGNLMCCSEKLIYLDYLIYKDLETMLDYFIEDQEIYTILATEIANSNYKKVSVASDDLFDEVFVHRINIELLEGNLKLVDQWLTEDPEFKNSVIVIFNNEAETLGSIKSSTLKDLINRFPGDEEGALKALNYYLYKSNSR